MSRYREPRLKKIRRLGALLGLTRKTPKSGSNPRNNKRAHKVVSKELIPLLGIQLLAILNKSRNSKLPVIQKKPKIPNNRPKSPTRLVTKKLFDKHSLQLAA